MVTVYRNIWNKKANEAHYISVDQALERIKSGRSKQMITDLRSMIDTERSKELKKGLPCVLFSGKFTDRKDECLQEHSGFIVLDFDHVEQLRDKQTEIISQPFVYACWVSPSGNGLKALVKIADGLKHRLHFAALKEVFPEIDNSGINESRVCYESYDPEIYINKSAKPFTKTVKKEKIEGKEALTDSKEKFDNLLKWLTNKGDAFVTGERNTFIFKLASACCRFGINEQDAISCISTEFLTQDSTFAFREAEKAIKSAYRSNKYGTAIFEKSVLIDTKTRSEVKIDSALFDADVKPKDVIFGEDVKDAAFDIYDNGHKSVTGIGCELDTYFKMKRGEITCLTGIGNYGKSSFLNWMLITRCIMFGEKFAIFSPENNPAHEFYHDLTEIYLGTDCTPFNKFRPNKMKYEQAYDFVSKHIFYVYPKELAPTPDYIKERFLELIIKEKVSGCIIDPFNQLTNDYASAGGRTDKYLETFLSDCSRFSQTNNIFFFIVAHPKMMRKDTDGNYPCPDVFDLADGAMWNNKMDNIIVYHRPNHQKEPDSPICELHSKKIRRQRQVGIKGVVQFELYRPQRRFYFNGSDILGKLQVEPQQEVIGFKAMDEMPF